MVHYFKKVYHHLPSQAQKMSRSIYRSMRLGIKLIYQTHNFIKMQVNYIDCATTCNEESKCCGKSYGYNDSVNFLGLEIILMSYPMTLRAPNKMFLHFERISNIVGWTTLKEVDLR
mgnify:CR=1 FL=1